MAAHPIRSLSLLESRVLGVLVEKQHTVPDTYPLSLNALVAGCNQKTSRDPVMNATEAEVQTAVDELKYLSLVAEGPGSRVTRYEHNVGRVLQVPSQSVAILTVLMLRGPQTAGELRINCERLHKFSDISSVEVFLHELRDRAAGTLVVELPRRPGERENRWAHLLSGAPADVTPFSLPEKSTGEDVTTLVERVSVLEKEVAELKIAIASLMAARA
jgi:uncharacterized protein YceH (UPF0502 family)